MSISNLGTKNGYKTETYVSLWPWNQEVSLRSAMFYIYLQFNSVGIMYLIKWILSICENFWNLFNFTLLATWKGFENISSLAGLDLVILA